MQANLFSTVKKTRKAITKHALLVSWCGMRGLVTLATALSLPAAFPQRDLIVLSAFAVVLGTLVVQGSTLGPLIQWLKFPPDNSFGQEVAAARVQLLDAAVESMTHRDDALAKRLRETYAEDRKIAMAGNHPREVSEFDALRRQNIAAKRLKLAELRREGKIDDDVFHALELELDWAELAASSPNRVEMVEI
jgi:CPA1 family monovalent cation:H+ antiporter